jgi:hypothetical protein
MIELVGDEMVSLVDLSRRQIENEVQSIGLSAHWFASPNV